MFFRPIISLITFPGVIAHEWAHKKFCNWMRVRVSRVVYFRFGNPAGFVEHEIPSTFRQTFWISVGPLIINTGITMVLSYIAFRANLSDTKFIILLWLAVSIGMNAFPSDHDVKNISGASRQAVRNGGSFLHYLAFPFVWLILLANKLRFFYFDLVYAILLVALGGGLLK